VAELSGTPATIRILGTSEHDETLALWLLLS
jgi:hypothetical protein